MSAQVSVRYIVSDVDAAVTFYTSHLGFQLKMRPSPEFAMLSRDHLRLLLSQPGGRGGGGQGMPDGRVPAPGGWNRFQIEVEDLEATVERLRQGGCRFRSEVITGIGAKQIILEDPSGNPVELVQTLRPR